MRKQLAGSGWFRWALAGTFIVGIFSLPLFFGQSYDYQTYYELESSAQQIAAPVSPDERMADYTLALVIWTAVLAAVGAIELLYIIRQERWMRANVKASQEAASAARRSAEAVPTIERAHVYPEIVSPGAFRQCVQDAQDFDRGNYDPDEPCNTTAEVTFRIKNYGKTPAVLKGVFVGLGVMPLGALIGIGIQESILGANESTRDLAAEMWRGLSRNEAASLLVYHKRIYFDGRIEFDDIWGNPHITEFRYAWEHSANQMQLFWVSTKKPEQTQAREDDADGHDASLQNPDMGF